MIKISLIIPTYNSKNTIIDCLNSVYNGQKIPYEVIIVDDCSTDDTTKLIQSKKFHNLCIFKTQKNSGPATARNLGAFKAKGTHLFFIDSDTIIDKYAISLYFKICNKFDAIVGVYDERPINDTIFSWYKSLLYYFMLGRLS